MTLQQIIEYTRGPRHTWVRRCLYALLALNILDNIPLITDKSHAHTWFEYVPAFWGVFGFVGCVILILVSKAFGHAGIMKREDYYDE
jgi:hypothetical protein